MTIDEATKHLRHAVRDIRQAGNEKRARDVEEALQVVLREAASAARRDALDTASRVIREL